MSSKKNGKPKPPAKEIVARNRRARHNYLLLEEVEAGLVLLGSEVKSLRSKAVTLDQAYARVDRGEVWLLGANFQVYGAASYNNHEPRRSRKLLLHRRQIRHLETELKITGRTLIPLELYFNEEGRAKLLLAVATGKQTHDKRQSMAEQDAKREMERALGRRR